MMARDVSGSADEALVRVGAVLGNATEDGWPGRLAGARAVMASVLTAHSFGGVSYEFVPGAEVLPRLAPREARRLFGGVAGHRHLNGPGPPGEAPR